MPARLRRQGRESALGRWGPLGRSAHPTHPPREPRFEFVQLSVHYLPSAHGTAGSGETEAQKEQSLSKYDFRPCLRADWQPKRPRLCRCHKEPRVGAGQARWWGPRLWCRFWVLTQPLEERLSLSTPASRSVNQSSGTFVSGAGGEGRFLTASVRGLSSAGVLRTPRPHDVVQRFTA